MILTYSRILCASSFSHFSAVKFTELGRPGVKREASSVQLSSHHPNNHANTNGATIVASLSMMYFGV
jgi:hypothetical protein